VRVTGARGLLLTALDNSNDTVLTYQNSIRRDRWKWYLAMSDESMNLGRYAGEGTWVDNPINVNATTGVTTLNRARLSNCVVPGPETVLVQNAGSDAASWSSGVFNNTAGFSFQQGVFITFSNPLPVSSLITQGATYTRSNPSAVLTHYWKPVASGLYTITMNYNSVRAPYLDNGSGIHLIREGTTLEHVATFVGTDSRDAPTTIAANARSVSRTVQLTADSTTQYRFVGFFTSGPGMQFLVDAANNRFDSTGTLLGPGLSVSMQCLMRMG
jgi:hypothetical protein